MSTTTKADGNSAVDDISITVPSSCTLSSNGTATTHQDTIANGITKSDIGTTTLTAYCNDNNGFAIYATGYTGDTLGNNKLIDTTTNNEINTSTTTGGNNPSSWAVKLATDSGATYPLQLQNSYNNYHTIPTDYEMVAKRLASTDVGSSATGSTLTTTYQAFISTTQPAGTYQGKVKYLLMHPNDTTAPSKWLTVNYDANGLYFNNDPTDTSNVVRYDATSSVVRQNVTKKSYVGSYRENGSFGSSGTPAGNNVVTIPGASTIHIAVTYGAPQNSGGPPSDLMIWAGNHPDYNNTNNGSTALTSCGGVNATNGAYSSNGSGGTQVTMECDITGDSVTFYDYSTNTGNSASMGYYAVVTGEGDVTVYDKTVISGTYATPTTTSGTNVFLGWSTGKNAIKGTSGVMYANESDFISSQAGDLANTDIVTLYAVWGKTFDAAMSDAGKTKTNGYYGMQDISTNICNEIYVGATAQFTDSRDTTPYTIGKLEDGKCWMLDNLALDLTKAVSTYSGADKITMNSTNTNATDTALGYLLGSTAGRAPASTGADKQYATSAVSTTWNNINNQSSTKTNSYSDPRISVGSINSTNSNDAFSDDAKTWKYGVYYNYCAASAGSYCYGNGTSYTGSPSDTQNGVRSIDSDICPAGWRMPTGNTNGEYNALYQQYGDYTAFRAALRLPLSGYFSSGSAYYLGSSGYFWSSTRNVSYSMYRLYLNTSNVDPSDYGNRNVGYSVRCLLGS